MADSASVSTHAEPVVVAAAIVQDGLLLAARRRRPATAAGRWELPGGKVEADEREDSALRREIHEELGTDIDVGERYGPDVAMSGVGVLRMYLARLRPGSAEPGPGPDHDELRWVGPEELDGLDWLEPDVPLVRAVREHLLDGVPLAGGNVGGAVRVGDTVRRPSGPWTPTIHALLRHLADRGLDGVPRVLGIDERDREILSYLPGRTIGDLGAVANVDRWPSWAFTDRLLGQVGRWLARFHAAAKSFRPEGEPRWRADSGPVGDDEIVCHNDVSPYNVVVDEAGDFVGMLDWDLARPGQPIDDAAFAAWNFVPFLADLPVAEGARRVQLLADAYGSFSARAIAERVAVRMGRAVARIRAGAEAGDPGMRHLVEIGEMDYTEQALERHRARMPALLDQLGR